MRDNAATDGVPSARLRKVARYTGVAQAVSRLASRLARLQGHDPERAQAMIEYALIMCLVVIVILVTLILLGNQVKNTYCNITSAVISA